MTTKNNFFSVYGTVGYTILKDAHRYIWVFADKHDELHDCENDIEIQKIFENKIGKDACDKNVDAISVAYKSI